MVHTNRHFLAMTIWMKRPGAAAPNETHDIII